LLMNHTPLLTMELFCKNKSTTGKLHYLFNNKVR
jgi:hypothetical protein